ncbi:uncharacterized protein MYCFIDRAFT_183555 [Pseudocercospora fijiensis CIRAD86]|uniref:Uncharacterized protein n=1 Tax=Pseudocercospora fijiensis (strain CIRAD86) TaxID=383855 RepID=M3ASG4_PSEFD|nr:uncharacterized protein MYCFIDRAFT_183555 [Pseudocercospora fijiensis CIRAD86]EME80447.1 hypothetical protein MYCFIDRAFT_183555 [Pseudocercospora fijiensis CIRAD86]
MVWQSWPAGQHSAAVIGDVVFNGRQLLFALQQKLDGNPVPHGVRFGTPPHVCASRLATGVDASGCQKAASFSSSLGIQSALAR